MTQQPVFINPAVIERLEQGTFVPARRSKSVAQERRNWISPLSVTKRCLRYDPNVFLHRKAQILQMAHALNQPEQKILLLNGPQGCGKTSLIRGLIELMGGGQEQLLWFDANRHTDFEEIIQFLLQYVTEVCQAAEEPQPNAFALTEEEANPDEGGATEPLRKLEASINRVGDMPLLIVLDNVEYLVDSELRFNSYPFKEMLNFLLAFANIKMVLIGERLPYADISPNQAGISDIKLSGLKEQDIAPLFQPQSEKPADPGILEQAAAPEAEQTAFHQLYLKTQGQPWLLKIIYYLKRKANLSFYTINRLLESESRSAAKTQAEIASLVRLVCDRLPDQHRQLLQTLCFLRHPVSAQALLSLMQVCYPVIGPANLTLQTLDELLEHSLLRPLLKISYPPQEVLSHIQHRRQQNAAAGKFKPGYELYHQVKRIIYQSLPPAERERIHGVLQDFYLREKSQDNAHRVLPIKNRAMIAEAKHHGSAARDRKSSRTAITVDIPTAATQDVLDTAVSVNPQAYLYRHVKPISRNQRFTLDDYRRISIPEAPGSSDHEAELLLSEEAEMDLDGPTFMELLHAQNPHEPDEPEPPQDPELSEEEHPPGPPPVDASPVEAPEHPPEAPLSTPPDLHNLTDGLLTESHTTDAREREIQNRLANAVANRDKAAMLQELLSLAQYRAGHGRYESARQCIHKALRLKNEAGPESLAEIYRLSGMIDKETYRHNNALSALTKAATYIKQLMYDDDSVEAVWMARLGQVCQNLGEIHAYRRQSRDALGHFEQAVRWYRAVKDTERLAEVYFRMAGVHDDLAEPEPAIAFYRKALELDEANRNFLSAASSLVNLGRLYVETGQTDQALQAFQQALAYDRQADNTEGQLNTLEEMVQLYLAQEDWPNAENTCQQALALAMQEDIGLRQASLYVKMGQLQALRQNFPEALRYYELAHSSGEKELATESLAWIAEKIDEMRHAIQG